MPPHCDSLDGPVVTAARRALETGDVTLVLPFVPAADEAEISTTFASVQEAASTGRRWRPRACSVCRSVAGARPEGGRRT